jgi:two-component system OmpR family response regulator
MSARVLVIDDEENIVYLVSTALRLQGFDVVSAGTARDGERLIGDGGVDLAIVDVMLPDLDGFTLVRRLRQSDCRVPVIFLTARDTTDDRVQGLTIGGDDYLVKPFAVAELVARVGLRLQRTVSGAADDVLRCADLTIDEASRRVSRAGTEIALTPTEYRLLRYLMINQGRVLTRAQILDHVWQYDFDGNTNVLDTFMSNLRKKVDAVDPALIRTVRGVGYCLRDGA